MDFVSPTILLGILLCPWAWDISSQLFQCHAAAAFTVFLGLLSFNMGDISLWSFQWSQPLLLTLDVEYLLMSVPALNSCQRAQTNLVHTRTQWPHRDWDTTVFECLLLRYRSAVDCHRDRGSGWSRHGYGISPLGRGSH